MCPVIPSGSVQYTTLLVILVEVRIYGEICSIFICIKINLSHCSVTLLESSAVTSVNEQICLSCSFSTSELTGCVGVIHSAQLENLALTVLSVERSGGVNCTVEMTEGNYTVAVFGWYGEMLEQEPANVTMITIGESL